LSREFSRRAAVVFGSSVAEGDHTSSCGAPHLLAPRKTILAGSSEIRTQDPTKRKKRERKESGEKKRERLAAR
jgi:hypothetical protein